MRNKTTSIRCQRRCFSSCSKLGPSSSFDEEVEGSMSSAPSKGLYLCFLSVLSLGFFFLSRKVDLTDGRPEFVELLFRLTTSEVSRLITFDARTKPLLTTLLARGHSLQRTRVVEKPSSCALAKVQRQLVSVVRRP